MIAVQIAGVILSPSHSPCCVAAGLLRTTHETCKSSYQASLLLLGRQRPSKRIAGAINDEDHRILVMSATAFGLVATGDSGQPDALAVEVGSAAVAAGDVGPPSVHGLGYTAVIHALVTSRTQWPVSKYC